MAEGAVFDAQAVTDAVAEGIAKIENASTMEELKAIKTQYAGAESAMTQASKAIGALPKDQKKDAGKLMGKLRADFGRAFGTKEKQVKAEEEARELAAETVDMTLPVNRKPLGARHPLPKLMEDVEDFFISMGWQISDGPEVETEWYDFDALNFGPDHPARQMQDTFYVKGNQAKDAAGFVGSDGKAIPLTEQEIYDLGVEHHEVVVGYELGDSVKITDGPLEGFIGTVDELEPDKDRVRVVVSMFGRETPVDLELDQVEAIKD